MLVASVFDMTEALRVVYCEGWDPDRRVISGRLPVAVARERDRAGEQYAFCLIHDDRVVTAAEIAWAAGFARWWFLDDVGRRRRMAEYRVLDGRLFLLRSREWTYSGAGQAEFADDCGFVEASNSPDGRSRRVAEPDGKRGGSRHEWHEVDPAGFFRDVPEFSDWAAISEAGAAELVEEDPVEQESAEPPWRPSAAMRPEGIEAAFRPGLRWRLPHGGDTVVVEVVDGGTVRMPSGRVVAADPSYVDGGRPFTATIAPGDYRVELSVVRFAAEPDHARVAAAKLVVSSVPVTSWELALSEGQNALLLGDGEYYGFGVDAGVGCFVDAAACAALAELAEESEEAQELLMTPMGPKTAVLTEPVSGATLVAYHSGWGDGSYPVWIGRTADGEIACFVADMLVLRGSEEELPDPAVSGG